MTENENSPSSALEEGLTLFSYQSCQAGRLTYLVTHRSHTHPLRRRSTDTSIAMYRSGQ